MIVTAATLNIRSGPGTEYNVIGKVHRDDKVEVSESNGIWRRIAPCGWVSSAWLTAPLFLAVPHGLAAIKKAFGEAGNPSASAGIVMLPEPLRVGWSTAGATISRVACHTEMEREFTNVFQSLHRAGLWPLIRTYDGIYNDRTKTASSTQKSTHAWGIAVDLNASTNRYGTKGNMDPRIIDIFEQNGFRHLKHDPMHFQYATGY